MRTRKAAAWALLLALSVAGVLVTAAQARAVATGKFTAVAMDTPTARTINTGLTNIRSLRIYVRVRSSSIAEVAATTDQIQGDVPGAFIYQNRWERGLTINAGGSFTATHAMFKRPGVTFYWEAFGD
jgi:hypothetical protein